MTRKTVVELDQEFTCDVGVIERGPKAKKTEGMVKHVGESIYIRKFEPLRPPRAWRSHGIEVVKSAGSILREILLEETKCYLFPNILMSEGEAKSSCSNLCAKISEIGELRGDPMEIPTSKDIRVDSEGGGGIISLIL